MEVEHEIPQANSHWSLQFVDVIKPYPDNILGNVTFKIIRFFYPPFALQVVNVETVVQNPQVNMWNILVIIGLPIIMCLLSYVMFKLFLEKKPVIRQPPERLKELEERMKEKYGSEYKLGIWRRKDIPDPLLSSTSLG